MTLPTTRLLALATCLLVAAGLLSGRAAAAISLTPPGVAFGSQPFGEATALVSVQVRNEGTSQVFGTGAQMQGSHPDDFSFDVPLACFALAPGQACTIQVGFRPSALGARSAQLVLGSSEPAEYVLPLSGTGVVRPAVSAADSHTLALDANGQVYAWGSDYYGQLGQGRAIHRTSPTQVAGLPKMKEVSAYRHVLALDEFGQVWSWGESCNGSLGPRAEANNAKPARVTGMTGVVAVSAGFCFSAALKADGSVWVWGHVAGLGDATNVRQVPGVANVVEIAAGYSHVLARRSDGSVMGWGTNHTGAVGTGSASPLQPPIVIPGLANVTGIAAGQDQSAAMRSNGDVLRWGGIFGGVHPAILSPTVIPGLGGAPVAIAYAQLEVYAVRADGKIRAYTHNGASWSWVDHHDFAGMATVSAVGVSTVGLDATGRVWAAGLNSSGQLGQGNTATPSGAVLVPGMGATRRVAISPFLGVLAVKNDGSLWFWGADIGVSGDGAPIRSTVPLPVSIPATIIAISAGYNYSLALDSSGAVWGWGTNEFAQLGPDGVNRSAAALIAGATGMAGVAAGEQFAMYRNADGTVWVSGFAYVQTATSDPVRMVLGLSDTVRIAAGQNGYAIDAAGVLRSFGLNQYGQLGNGTTSASLSPVVVDLGAGVQVAGVSEGTRFGPVGAVSADGRAWMWGTRFHCCLGNGTSAVSYTPVQVPGIADAAEISVGRAGTLLRRQGGSIMGWGQSLLPAKPQLTPIAIPFPQAVQSVAASGDTAFILGSTGLLWGFGSTFSDALATVGDGTLVKRASPVVVHAANGAGSIDAGNWFLDLDAASVESVPAAAVPTALAIARGAGTVEGVSLSATIKYRAADLGKRVQHYVLGVVPPEFFDQVAAAPGASEPPALKAKAAKAGGFLLVQLTPAGWVDVNGQLIAYSTGVANASGGASNILNGINGVLIPGSRFCVGYGETAQSMLSAAALREVLLLEGTASTVSGVPCVLSGVYVDGPASSKQGTPVTFNASVIGIGPTGGVVFKDGFANLGGTIALTASNPAVARASITTYSLVAGTHSINVSYSGDALNLAASTALPVLHSVSAPMAGTRTDLAGPASSLAGAEVAFTVTVTGDAPTGTVQFRDGAASLGAPVPLVGATATLRIASLALGSHSVSAVYSGDAGNTGSTSNALDHLVANTIVTRAVVTSPTANPQVGTAVTIRATVTGANPGGTVQFLDSTAALGGPVALSAGIANLTTSTLGAGTHVITARYSGDANNPQVSSPPYYLEVTLTIDPAQANVDTDGDGVTNAIEAAEGRNPLIKDNDIYAVARLFAMQQYRDFLGREGDAGGIAFWAGQLESASQTRAQMVETYLNSAEFQGTGAPVARLYFAYFLRIPDYGGLNFWIAQFRGGSSLETISNAFAGSAEFNNTYGALDNAQFVSLVYQNVLGRAPDAAGSAYWTGQLNAGMTRGQMMVAFSESAEYRGLIANEVYVTMIYSGMLRRAPDAGGFAYWVDYIDDGNSGLALIDLFLGSIEYRGRFLP